MPLLSWRSPASFLKRVRQAHGDKTDYDSKVKAAVRYSFEEYRNGYYSCQTKKKEYHHGVSETDAVKRCYAQSRADTDADKEGE